MSMTSTWGHLQKERVVYYPQWFNGGVVRSYVTYVEYVVVLHVLIILLVSTFYAHSPHP